MGFSFLQKFKQTSKVEFILTLRSVFQCSRVRLTAELTALVTLFAASNLEEFVQQSHCLRYSRDAPRLVHINALSPGDKS
jgi:hypothetical protein